MRLKQIQLLLLFAIISDHTHVQSISSHPTEIKALGIKRFAVQFLASRGEQEDGHSAGAKTSAASWPEECPEKPE